MVELGLAVMVGGTAVLTAGIWSGWAGQWATRSREVGFAAVGPLVLIAFAAFWVGSRASPPWDWMFFLLGAAGAVAVLVCSIHLPAWAAPRWYREARREWDDEVLPDDLVPPRAERMRRPLGRAEQRPVKTQRLAMNRPRPRPWS